MKVKEAIVLAGGFGTRLRAVVSDVPKPMAPINDRPFLELVLDQCQKYGIEKVVLAVGFKREVIMQHFGEAYKGMTIEYSIEEDALGTGGGILQAAQLLGEEPFLVLNGDTLFKVDLQALAQFYTDKEADMAIALCQMKDFDRYGVVELDTKGRITAFREKQYQAEGDINAGVYVLNKQILLDSNLPQKFSFEKDFMEAFVEAYRFYGMPTTNYFIDIGIPTDYAKAQEDLV